MNKAILMILDGFGLGPDPKVDAIKTANTPFYDRLISQFPHSTLVTHGLKVGLPEGQMGNSEVGHTNLGAGRIVYQDLTKIDLAIQNDSLKDEKSLKDLISYSLEFSKPIHLIGLVSDGGVHSHIKHLFAILNLLEKTEVREIYIHAITDGRDTDPKAFAEYLVQLNHFLTSKKAKLSTIIGRYYAMDRDNRWERIAKAYYLYTQNKGKYSTDGLTEILSSYKEGVTDEFINPIQLVDQNMNPLPCIKNGDAVYCFNFRSDRMRQLTQVLTQEKKEELSPLKLKYLTMTEYDPEYKDIQVVFHKDEVTHSLGEMLSKYGLTQLRIAETEKYPHVSYFFNGGREKPFSGERRIMISSPKVATYDLKPEMSAFEVTDALINDLKLNHPEFVCINFANTDMVGHTGVFAAAVKAAETIDQCLSQIIPLAQFQNYNIVILADHGNSDCMINPDGTPNTAHTKNPVPCILISNEDFKLRDGKLADIAPTLLEIMNLPIPVEMTGESLLLLK
ncbi:MAG: 2,3-bisphosphoglycerate-independent phosphoglycerate mutase [Saprospiraceae bacterium]|nr:2,3-bisphosphoglycerate-independent phosphoglycerate mutase [Saprospiraceae bacterium]